MTQGNGGGGGRRPAPTARREKPAPASAPERNGGPAAAIPTVVVQPGDALEDVLGRLRDAAAEGRAVGLTIPANSALFLTASEFRALKEVADRGRLAVTVRSPDTLRLRLARMLGFDTAGDARPRPERPASPPPAPTPTPSIPPAAPPTAAPSPPRPTVASSPSVPQVHSSERPAPPPSATAATVVDLPGGATSSPQPPATAPATPHPAVPNPPPTEAPSRPRAAAEAVAGTALPATDGAEPATSTVVAPPAADWPAPPPPETAVPRRRTLRRPFALPGRRSPAPAAESTPGPQPAPSDQPAAALVVPAPPLVDDSAPLTPTAPPPAVEERVEPARAATGSVGRLARLPNAGRLARLPSAARSTADRLRGAVAARPLPFAIGAAVAVVALAALLVPLLLPRAKVGVELRRQPVRAELLYDVTNDGEPLAGGAALAVAGESATVEVTVEASIPTTGIRADPDGTAAGSIRLANPTAEELTVEAGTVVATEAGVEFAFLEDVAVPPADPDAERIGAATGRLRALEPGTGGNVETGEIGGRLPSGVYYSNRDGPTEGGTDREVRVVAPEDVEALRDRVDDAVPAAAEAAFARELGEQTAALPGSFSVGKGSESFDHEVGDEAATISATGVRSVTALTYDQAAVRERLDGELRDRLAAEAPEGYAVDDEEVALARPAVVREAAAGTRFRLAAEAAAVAVLDEAERQELAERLAGEDPAAVATVLADVPEIAGADVAYRPGWLPDRMPGSAGRIEIETER